MLWSWRIQLAGHCLVSLVVVTLVAFALSPVTVPTTEAPRPFSSSPNMLAVTVRIAEAAPPEIVAIETLAMGRLTITPPGPYQLTLLDNSRQAVFSLSFGAVFAFPGWEGVRLDAVDLIFIVPGRDAVHIEVSGPQGSTQKEIAR